MQNFAIGIAYHFEFDGDLLMAFFCSTYGTIRMDGGGGATMRPGCAGRTVGTVVTAPAPASSWVGAGGGLAREGVSERMASRPG